MKRCHPVGACLLLGGKPWCAEHQERLNRVRDELAVEQDRHSNWTHDSQEEI